MADIFLDCALIGFLILIKTIVLRLIAPLISRREAVVSWRKCVFVAIVLDTAFMLARTSPSYITIFNAYLAAALVGTLIGPKLFQITLGTSFCLHLLFMFLSVVITDGAAIGMNRLIPKRTTISSTFSEKLDTWTCQSAQMPEMEMSSSLGEAISRAGTEYLLSGPIGLFVGVTRASNATGKVAELQATAAGHAAFIDELSTAGMNASTNIEQLVQDAAESGTVATLGAPVETQLSATDTNAPQHHEKTPGSGDSSEPPKMEPRLVAAKRDNNDSGTLLGAVADGVGSLLGKEDEGGGSADPGTVETEALAMPAEEQAETRVPEKDSKRTAPDTSPAKPNAMSVASVSLSSEVVDPLGSIPEEKREDWKQAQSTIKVNGVMKAADGKYTVLIGGDVIVAGETTEVDYDGETYTFRLMGIKNRNTCVWSPVTLSTNDVDNGSDFVPFQ